MALNINPSQYNAGSAVINVNPAINYLFQQAARREARNNALDDYYANIHKSINPAGMRVQDLENGFNQKVNDWKGFYFQNKAAIKDPSIDNGRALNEFNSRYTDLNTDVLKSKDAAQMDVAMAKAKAEGWEPTDDDMIMVQRMGLPISDPRHYKDQKHTPFDMMDFSISHPQFGPKEQANALKLLSEGITPEDQQGDIRIDKVAGTKTIPYTKMYTQKQLETIGEKAAHFYRGDKAARNFFQKELHNENEIHQLNDAFKSVYGRDITTPEEAYQGWAIMNKKTPQGTTEKVLQYVDPNKRIKEMAQSLANSKELARYRKSLGIKEDEGSYEDPLEPILQKWETAAKARKILPYTFSNGQKMDTYVLAPSDQLKKMMTTRDGAHVVQPDEYRIAADNGDYLGIFLKKDDKGNRIVGENGASVVDPTKPPIRIARDDIKIGLGNQILTKKENQKVLENQNKPKKVTLGHGSLDND